MEVPVRAGFPSAPAVLPVASMEVQRADRMGSLPHGHMRIETCMCGMFGKARLCHGGDFHKKGIDRVGPSHRGVPAGEVRRGVFWVGGLGDAGRRFRMRPFRSRCEPHHATVKPLGPQSKRFAMWSIAVLSVIAAALIAAGFSAGFPDK
ncbi:hypothetical protein [Nocardia aobensis]|uniref:hypothetical protein n=1 Tax=Nocardia aobensis TaxID=257277 RepID=UPI0012F6E46C|nr:hypothetical protein [Nocardia aobensis]